MASRVFRFLRELLDVDTTGVADGDALVYDSGTQKWIPGAGGGGASAAEDVDFTPAGSIAATDVQAAIVELDSEKAAVSHAHAGEDITSGTVADARIASTIARDSEVTSAISALSTVYQPLDSDLTSIAALSTTAFGRALLELADEAALKAALNLEAGTDYPSQTTFDDHSGRHEDGGADEISLQGLSGTSAALQAHLDDTADAHDASAISIVDAANDFTATDVEGALAELQSDHETDAQNLADHIADSSAAHAASAISADSTTLVGTGTDVQAVLEELDNAVAAAYTAGGTDVALGDGGTGATLSDPGADRIMFWDDSAGTVDWLTAGSGLTITGTTISASGSSVTGEEETLVIAAQLFA